jgi:hypothetical protein
MSNVRPPSARRGMLNQGHAESEQWSNCARARCLIKSKASASPWQAWLCGRAGQVPPSGRQSERVQLSLSTGGQSKFERGGRLFAYAHEIQGRSAGHRTYRQARRSLEGTTHARPARPMQVRVAAFVRVTHTVAHMSARVESNGYGTVSMHARPNSYAPQPEV